MSPDNNSKNIHKVLFMDDLDTYVNVNIFCNFDSIYLNFSIFYPWLDGVRIETVMKGGLFIGLL